VSMKKPVKHRHRYLFDVCHPRNKPLNFYIGKNFACVDCGLHWKYDKRGQNRLFKLNGESKP